MRRQNITDCAVIWFGRKRFAGKFGIFSDLINVMGLLCKCSAGQTRALAPASCGPHSATLRPGRVSPNLVYRHLHQTSNRGEGL